MDFEIVDDLVTEDPYAALSANMGVTLRQMIENTATDDDIDAIFM